MTQASVYKATGYELLIPPAGVTKATTYEVLVDPNSVTKVNSYVILVPEFPPIYEFSILHAFVEERFPDCVSFGTQGGPGFKTNVFQFDSGIVSVDQEWDRLRARYSVTFETASPEEIQLVEDFFYICKGRGIGFRFKDWQDYQIVDQNVAVGDGITNSFPVFKRYQSGDTQYDRPIKKPLKVSADGTDMHVTVNGVTQTIDTDVFVNESLGTLNFSTPPEVGSLIKIAYGEFDVPVRFDTDTLDISFDDFRQLSLEVPLIEILT